MVSFNSNDSTEKLCPLAKKFRPEVTDQMEKVVLNALKYNVPQTCIENSLKILNEVPGSKFHLPETKYKMRQTIEPVFEFEVHYKCEKCKIYTGIQRKQATSNHINCKQCNGAFDRKTNEFFIYIPLEQQLRLSIEKNFNSIVQFKNSHRDGNNVSDPRDGTVLKTLDAKYPNAFNLSLILNTDGAQVFDSTKKSLWPLQLIQNFLHPKIRYLTSNILLVGLIFVKGKPDPAQFFFPLIQELNRMHQNGFKIDNLSSELLFRPFITHCVCDLPARAKCQGILQYNGKYACCYCLHPGVSIENKNAGVEKKTKSKTIRFVRQSEPALLRTHSEVVCCFKKLQKSPKNPVFGFQALSAFIGVPEFDLIHGFSIDYMHCILLGTTPKVVGFWLNSTNCDKPYYMKKAHKNILNRRILSIRPPSCINRKPRSLEEREFFKANEWRSFLFYYLRYNLVGLIPFQFIAHFELLSSATYILSKKAVHKDEIANAKAMLIQFADEFEDLYGKTNVTMNVHLLRHVADSVVHSGPLWSQSMFAFEQSNGELVNMVNGKNCALLQITEKYILRKTLMPQKELNHDLTTRCQQFNTKLSEEEKAIISKYVQAMGEMTYWASVDINGEKYTSMMYKETNSIDYFAVFTNDEIGKIKYYIKSHGIVYAIVESYRPVEIKHHMYEVISKQSISIFTTKQITEKLIYMRIGAREIVCRIPNTYEKT